MTIPEAQKAQWLKQDLWTLDEAAYLLVGHKPGALPPSVKKIDTKIYTKNLDNRLEATIQAHTEYLNFRQSVRSAHEALTRAIESQNLLCVKNKWVHPADVIRWASEADLWPEFPFSSSHLADRPAPPISTPIKKRTIQADWILKTIRAMGYEPSKLPRKPNGHLGWRGEVKRKLPPKQQPLDLTEKRFDKLWQELRASGEIREI
ncbi:MAG: hypothetical protein RI949_1842 [Pseudomonadota bacterium]|jgi:hypothetical protein